MSALILNQTKTAVAANLTASFLAGGGTGPYTYVVRPNGAGGTINSVSGLYTAPAAVPLDPAKLYDIIDAKDSLNAIITSKILVATPLLLFCEIIQRFMGLPDGRVFLWDQKIFQPTDPALYIAVQVLTCKPFGNTKKFDGTTNDQIQSVNMHSTLQVDIMSRSDEARDRKEEIVLALNSQYSEFQQEANSFYIGKLPPGSQFVNLSNQDGAAIPYRFNIAVAIQYFVTKALASDYFDTFQTVSETIEP